MISRYSSSEIEKIWSEQHKFDLWLLIEKLVVKYLAINGNIPQKDADIIIEKASFTLDKVKAKERETKHELAAFVDVLAESVGPEGRWIHYGLTSSDVLDTALALQMREVVFILTDELNRLYHSISSKIEKNHIITMAGRTHGMHAEKIDFHDKLFTWMSRLSRDIQRLKRLAQRDGIFEAGGAGKISGTVGTYSTISHWIEEDVMEELGLTERYNNTQVVARDIHADFVWSLANIATTLDSIATDIRILSMSEIGELAEGFSENQKGSSAMPHKRNPVRSERISGLARLARAYVIPALENSVLWNERDISHSSVERIMLPDLSSMVHFMIKEMIDIFDNLQIFPQKMRQNLLLNKGTIESHHLMLALIRKGLSRQEAYKKIQDLSFKTFEDDKSFMEVCKEEQIFSDNELFHYFDVVFWPEEKD